MAATIYALSSGRPPAAIAVIRVSGPGAHAAAAPLCGELPEPRHAVLRTLRDPASGEALDDALVVRFDRPRSATGEDVVELHCHGGRAVTEAVLAALGRCGGLRLAEPGEFTRRALANGRIDLTEAEGLADLLAAETESQRRAALALADGGLRRTIEEWRGRLLALSAAAELAIDYVGEEDADAVPDLVAPIAELRAEICEWLARPRIEPLREGALIVIAGPPNAGKSSLLNALVGHERAIVAAEAGTTRDHIEVPMAIDGVPVRLTDTAGLREADDRVEAEGVERARRLVEAADIVLWLGDPGAAPAQGRVLRIQAKADLLPAGSAGGSALRVSALTGAGIGDLLERLASEARSLLPAEGAIALNARQARELSAAAGGLAEAGCADPVVRAEGLRLARAAFDRITGRAGVEEFLDSLFARFCLGK